jgi:tetratricopeptide (TPR) repeat protein
MRTLVKRPPFVLGLALAATILLAGAGGPSPRDAAESAAKVCATVAGDAGIAACREAITGGYFDQGRAFPSSVEAYERLGRAFGELGRWEDACRAYRERIRLDRQNPMAHYQLGVVLLERLERPEEALGPLLEALRLQPDYANALYAVGAARARLEQNAEALDYFKKAINLNTRDGRAYEGLAASLSKLGQLEEAARYYRAAVTLLPEPATAFEGLGRCLLRLRLYDEATKAFAEATKLEPLFGEAYGGLGVALNMLRRYDEAVRALEKARTLDRNYFARHPDEEEILQLSRQSRQGEPRP